MPSSAQLAPASESVDNIADRVRVCLHKHYRQYECLERLFTDETVPMSSCYVNLALAHKAQIMHQEHQLDEDNPANDTALADTLAHTKPSHECLYTVSESINPQHLFTWSDKEKKKSGKPTKILITGLPGSGKTTLFKYCINEWKEGHLWPGQFQAVFLLELRTVAEWLSHRTDAPSLAIVLHAMCLGGLEQEKPSVDMFSQYLYEHKDQIAFFCDGYDEILGNNPHELSGLNSLLAEISQYKYVAISSRPRGLAVIEPQHRAPFDRHLENLGFTDENIEAFVRKHIADKGESDACLQFLHGHPSIWGTAHTPIHLVLMLFLWQQGSLQVSASHTWTLSRLYREIIFRLSAHNTKKHPSLGILIQSQGPSRLTVALRFLEYLARPGMQQDKLLYTGNCLHTALDQALSDYHVRFNYTLCEHVLQAAMDIGLLKCIQTRGQLLDKTYYFAHLSFQEYMAACCIKRMMSNLNTLVGGSPFEFRQLIEHKYAPRLQLMWWFTAGLLYHEWKHSALDKKNTALATLLRFWRSLLAKPRDIIGVRHLDLVAHCLDECEADESIPLLKAVLEQQALWVEYWINNTRCYSYKGFESINRLYRYPRVMQSREVANVLLTGARHCQDYYKRLVIFQILSKFLNPTPAVIAVFLDMLKSDDCDMRVMAVTYLISLKEHLDEATDALLLLAMNGRGMGILPDLMNSADEIVDILLLRAKSKDWKLRQAALRCLSSVKNKSTRIISAFLTGTKDDVPIVRTTAAATLSQLKNTPEGIISILMDVALTEDSSFFKELLRGLKTLVNPSVDTVKILLIGLRSEHRQVREVSQQGLFNLSNLSVTVVDILLAETTSEVTLVRQTALFSLGYLTNPSEEVINFLLTKAHDEHGQIRLSVLSSLSSTISPSRKDIVNPSQNIIDALVTATRNEDDAVCQIALRGLSPFINLFPGVIAIFIRETKNKNNRTRQIALKGLGYITNPSSEVIEILLAEAKGRDDLGLAALGSLCRIANSSVTTVPTLILSTLGDDEDDRQQRIFNAASTRVDRSASVINALLTLVEEFKDEGHLLRMVCLKNLSATVVDALLRSVEKIRDSIAYTNTLLHLSTLTNPTEDVIRALLMRRNDENGKIRHVVMKGLGCIKNPSPAIIQVFLEALRPGNNYSTRMAALENLSKIMDPSPAVISALLKSSNDKDLDVRSESLRILGRINPPSKETVGILLKKTRGWCVWTRKVALESLRQIKNPSWEIIHTIFHAALAVPKFDVRPATLKRLRFNVCSAALESLRSIINPCSTETIKGLLTYVKNENKEVCQAILKILSTIKNPSETVIDVLLKGIERDLLFELLNGAQIPVLSRMLCADTPQADGASGSKFSWHDLFIKWCYEQYDFSLTIEGENLVLQNSFMNTSIFIPKTALSALLCQFKIQARQNGRPLGLFNLSGYESGKTERAILQSNRPSPFIVSNTMWVVHLAKKKGIKNQHTFLLIEGFRDEEHFSERYELIQLPHAPRQSLRLFSDMSSSLGTATIIEKKDFLDKLECHAKEYESCSWEITNEIGEAFSERLSKQVGTRLSYSGSGGSKRSRGKRAYNCFTWAEEQLESIGLRPPPGHWFDLVVVLPTNHMPTSQASCLVM